LNKAGKVAWVQNLVHSGGAGFERSCGRAGASEGGIRSKERSPRCEQKHASKEKRPRRSGARPFLAFYFAARSLRTTVRPRHELGRDSGYAVAKPGPLTAISRHNGRSYATILSAKTKRSAALTVEPEWRREASVAPFDHLPNVALSLMADRRPNRCRRPFLRRIVMHGGNSHAGDVRSFFLFDGLGQHSSRSRLLGECVVVGDVKAILISSVCSARMIASSSMRLGCLDGYAAARWRICDGLGACA